MAWGVAPSLTSDTIQGGVTHLALWRGCYVCSRLLPRPIPGGRAVREYRISPTTEQAGRETVILSRTMSMGRQQMGGGKARMVWKCDIYRGQRNYQNVRTL